MLAVPLAGLHAEPQKQQAREAVAILEANVQDGETVVVAPAWDSSYDYYLEDWSASGPPQSHGLNVRRIWPSAGQLRSVAAGQDVVWLVVSFVTPEQRERMVAVMEGLGFEIDRHPDLEKVDVYRFVAAE